MGLIDALKAKAQAAAGDYQKEQRLKRAADLAYKAEYERAYAPALIKDKVALAKANAQKAAKAQSQQPTGFAGQLAGMRQTLAPMSGFPAAMDLALMGKAPPKAKAPHPKPYRPTPGTVIHSGGQTITISPQHHHSKKKAKPPVDTGWGINPAILNL